jgi:hypothetical protein
MVRDYLASGLHGSPLHYADGYYRHYPKIGLGVWPPFFYAVQAVWTLVFPAGVGSVLWLMALLALCVSLVAGWWLWREFGWLEALAGTLLLTSLPLVQQYSNMVMAEMLSTLLMFGATGYFARFMEREARRDAIGFGICAGLAIMTKGTGLALAFMPALAILFANRYPLLRRPGLWGAALLVAVIAGPWTWHFRNEGRGGWEQPSPSLGFTEAAITFYGRSIAVALGGMLALLALAGAISLFLPGARKPAIAQCSLALVLGVWVFQCLTPVGLEARHLTPAMPALIILAMTGFSAMTARMNARARMAITVALLGIFFGWPALVHPPTPPPGYGSLGNQIAVSPFRIPRKEWSGFEPIALAALAARPGAPILIASDARGEGMFIADVAVMDPHRPGYVVQRASKILASSTWSGSGYQSLYQTPAQVQAALSQAGIRLVVTDASLLHPSAHEALLTQAVAGFPIIGTSSALRDGVETPGSIVLRSVPATR